MFMVEMVVSPVFRVVALGAILVRIIFFGELALMHIRMTFHAAGSDLDKLPLPVIRQVAFETGRRQVSALKRETGFCMLLKTEITFLKSRDRMALAAIRAIPVFYKLSIVKILMAGAAAFVGQGIQHAARMALPAVNTCVFAFQWKCSAVVVEIFPGIAAAKPLFVMALGAI